MAYALMMADSMLALMVGQVQLSSVYKILVRPLLAVAETDRPHERQSPDEDSYELRSCSRS